MHRRWYTRFGSLLLAAWFVCYGTEPLAALHHCPMHDGTMGTMAVGATGAMDASSGMPHGDHQSVPSHRTCTCMGDCAAATLVGLSSGRVSLAVGIATAAPAPQSPAGPAYYPVAAPHALPFPNGPPSRA